MSRRHDFAPGTIEKHRTGWLGTRAQRRELRIWLEVGVLLMFIVGSISLVVGVLVGYLP